jgi:hypothetical protein
MKEAAAGVVVVVSTKNFHGATGRTNKEELGRVSFISQTIKHIVTKLLRALSYGTRKTRC